MRGFVCCGMLLALAGALLWTGFGRYSNMPDAKATVICLPERLTISGGAEERLVTKSIELVNHSPEPVDVANIRGSCGCTRVLPLTATRVAPGSSLPFSVEFTLPEFGDRDVQIQVELANPGIPPVTVPVRLEGRRRPIPSIDLLPDTVVMNAIHGGPAPSRTLSIQTLERQGSPCWLRNVVARSPVVVASLSSTVKELPTELDQVLRRIYEVRVELKVPLTDGEPGAEGAAAAFDEHLVPIELEFATDLEDSRREVMLQIRRQRAASLVPSELVFVGGKEQRRPVFVFAESSTDGVARLVAKPDWLQVQSRECDHARAIAAFEVVVPDDVSPTAGRVVIAAVVDGIHEELELRIRVESIAGPAGTSPPSGPASSR